MKWQGLTNKWTLGQLGKTNPKRTQTNPIKANSQYAKMNVNKVLTEDYEKMSNWAIYLKQTQTNPIQTQYEPNLSQFLLLNRIWKMPKDIENYTCSVYNQEAFKHWICMNRPLDDRRGGFAELAVARDISFKVIRSRSPFYASIHEKKRKDMQ